MIKLEVKEVITYKDVEGNSFDTKRKAMLSNLETKAAMVVNEGVHVEHSGECWVDNSMSLEALVTNIDYINEIVAAYIKTQEE